VGFNPASATNATRITPTLSLALALNRIVPLPPLAVALKVGAVAAPPHARWITQIGAEHSRSSSARVILAYWKCSPSLGVVVLVEVSESGLIVLSLPNTPSNHCIGVSLAEVADGEHGNPCRGVAFRSR
jgi:hypothetical protein